MITHAELLALTPDRYLAQGYRTPTGRAHPELTALWAMAAAEQLRAQGVKAATLDGVVASVTRAVHEGQPMAAVLATSAAPAPVQALLERCVKAVQAEEDRAPFTAHLAAVLSLLSLAEASGGFNAENPRG